MARVVHISDLHISEHLLRGSQHESRLPHRYGHHVGAFLALDMYLKNTDWDLLLITGDISRIGKLESFEWARNWLENEIVFGETHVGLNLSKSRTKRYAIIPGNHDRFNGSLTQGSLDNYHQEFPVIRPGAVESFNIGGITLNVHLFDSSYEKGNFAFGMIDQRSMVPKSLREDQVDLAILHHHFLQPPKHPREISTELINSAEVATYMLNSGFDGVLFGHTHRGYIGRPSVEILSGLLNDRRKLPRFWTRMVPKFMLRKKEDQSLLSYNRETAQNGQLPTLTSYFDFLYLRQKGYMLRGPSEFASIRGFYEQMQAITSDSGMGPELENAKQKRVLISLAPSACQSEASWNGFHVIDINRTSETTFSFEWDRFEFEGSEFRMKPRDVHVC